MLSFLNSLLGRMKKRPSTKSTKTVDVLARGSVQPLQAEEKPKDPDEGKLKLSYVHFVQKMWGEGFSAPLDGNFIIEMAMPLSLGPQKSVLDLSAGLGGPARALTKHFKTYVTGLERRADLAEEGMKQSTHLGFARSAPIAHYQPEQFTYSKRVDVIVIRDLLYCMKDKKAFIATVASLLKDHGQLLITDFVCEEALLVRPPIAMWMEGEPGGVVPLSIKQVTQFLKEQGFDVRVSEDLTKKYTQSVLRGLSRLVTFLQGKKLSVATKKMLGSEVDLWTKRVGALEAGVTYTRFYAIKTL